LVNIASLPSGQRELLGIGQADGNLQWSQPLDCHSISPIAVLGHRLFFTTPQKTAYIAEILNEQQQFSDPLSLSLPASNVQGRPIGGGKHFFAFAQNQVVAVHAADKQVRPLYRLPQNDVRYLAYHDGKLYILDNEHTIYVVDVDTGNCLTTIDLERGASSPLSVGKHLYVGVKKHRVGKTRTYALHAYDLETHELAWEFITHGHVQAMVGIHDQQVFVGTLKGALYAVDENRGTAIWPTPVQLERQRIISTPAVVGNHLFFGTREGMLYCVTWRLPQQSHPDRSADYYRGSGDYLSAGKVELLAENYETAADDFAKAEEHQIAAQIFARQLGDWAHAGEQFEQAELYEEAADAFEKGEKFEHQGEMFMLLERYGDAAAAFARGSHFKKQGDALEAAGLLLEAAEVYKTAKMYHKARELYDLMGEHLLFAETYLIGKKTYPKEAAKRLADHKLYEEGAELFIRYGHTDRAADFLYRHGDGDGLIALWLAQNEFAKAAKVAQDYQRWKQAVELWEQAGEHRTSAELYEKAGEAYAALRLYTRLGDFAALMRVGSNMRDKTVILNAAKKTGDWATAGRALSASGFPVDAATAYEKAELWAEAAELYDQSSDDRAVFCWIKANQRLRAAEFLSRIGNDSEAAKHFEWAGEKMRAADIYREIGETGEALRLYRELDVQEEALKIYRSQEDWKIVAELANELRQYEQAAEACLTLAEESSLSKRYDYYRAAAQAFERAARHVATHQSETREHLISLWTKAETFYEKGADDEQAAVCKHERYKLLEWPIIIPTITTNKPLIETNFGSLDVVLENVGFGSGFLVDICVDSESMFDGGNLDTTMRVTRELRSKEIKRFNLNVKPNEGVRGDEVPLKFRLDYILPNNEKHSESICGTVPVKARETLIYTPHSRELGYSSNPNMNASRVINIYGGKQIFAEGDVTESGNIVKGETIHTGDHVEINRSVNTTHNNTVVDESLSPRVDIQHKTCVACEALVPQEDHFCLECGHRF